MPTFGDEIAVSRRFIAFGSISRLQSPAKLDATRTHRPHCGGQTVPEQQQHDEGKNENLCRSKTSNHINCSRGPCRSRLTGRDRRVLRPMFVRWGICAPFERSMPPSRLRGSRMKQDTGRNGHKEGSHSAPASRTPACWVVHSERPLQSAGSGERQRNYCTRDRGVVKLESNRSALGSKRTQTLLCKSDKQPCKLHPDANAANEFDSLRQQYLPDALLASPRRAADNAGEPGHVRQEG